MANQLQKTVAEAWESGSKVWCKYCYSICHVELGDGIYECADCGYGLAPMELCDEELDDNAH